MSGLDGRPATGGLTVSDRRKVLGEDIVGEWEVTAMEPERRLSLRVAQGRFRETTCVVEPLDDGTSSPPRHR